MEHNFTEEFERYLEQERHLALMVHHRAAQWGDSRVAVRHKVYGVWEAFTWRQLGEMINVAAKTLLAWGVGELEMVGIFAHNRVEWAVADYACFSVRACSVPVYATNSTKELAYIINDADIRILFVGNQEQYEKAKSLLTVSKTLKKIVVFDRTVKIEKSDDVMTYDDFLALGRHVDKERELAERLRRATPDDLSTLIYTSGTTGEPKGVMLTHKNWFAMLFGTGYYIPVTEGEVNLAFLPLSHVFERAWSYFILCRGGQVDYCHDTKAILDFLKESRPHYMCSVPRMWEKVHAMVLENVQHSPEKKKKIFHWALSVGSAYQYALRDGKPIGIGLKVQHALADKLVLKKVRDLFGGRNKVFNCGGSAFSAEISEFFFKVGVLLLQGYGLTECFVISVASPQFNKFGTCGRVVPLMNVRISDEGEIQAKGPSMTQGYWRKQELTRELFTEDGWVKTGDMGMMDAEGYITITDRIKELIKTSGGKYISPQQIETLLKEDLYFEQVATIGDKRPFVTALVVPAFAPLEAYAKSKGIIFASRDELVKKPEIIQFYREKIDMLTVDLGQVEKVKRFTILPSEFTQEDGEMTPTQKLRRKVIEIRYEKLIEAMYRSPHN